jgi:hypothetical protein
MNAKSINFHFRDLFIKKTPYQVQAASCSDIYFSARQAVLSVVTQISTVPFWKGTGKPAQVNY